MQIHIRQELSKDYKEVFSLIEKATSKSEGVGFWLNSTVRS